MQQDVVKDHQPEFDLGIALSAAILRVRIFQQCVETLITEMVDVSLLPEVERSDVTILSRFGQKMLRDGAAVPVDKPIELARKNSRSERRPGKELASRSV